MKNMLTIVGKTTNERPVVSGFFKLIDGHGVNLGDILHYFHQHRFVPDWLGFLSETLHKGWNIRSTTEKIYVACLEVHGKEHA